MKLASYDRFRKAISFDQGVQQDALEAALDRATAVISGDLRNPSFDRASFTDTFYINRHSCLVYTTGTARDRYLDLSSGGGGYRTRLALSHGFLSAAATATWSGSWEGLSDDPTSIAAGGIITDLVKGEVQIVGTDLRDCYVRVAYTAGFLASGSVYQSVPEWLQSAAVTKATSLLDQSNPSLRHENGAERIIKELELSYVAQINSRVRYFPSATHPMG